MCESLLCVTSGVTQRKPRAMHVSTEKAIALIIKPPFDMMKAILCQLLKLSKGGFYEIYKK